MMNKKLPIPFSQKQCNDLRDGFSFLYFRYLRGSMVSASDRPAIQWHGIFVYLYQSAPVEDWSVLSNIA